MESEGSTCSICLCQYDQDLQLPRILPDCGHTICTVCLSLLLKKQNFKCPLDNVPFSSEKKSLEDFKINYSLKQMLDERKEGSCPEHNMKMRLLCYTDKVQICDDCALFGQHAGHKIEALRQVLPKIEKKKKNLEEAIEVIDEHEKDLNVILNQSEEQFTKVVKINFENLRGIMERKEEELLEEVSSFFERTKMEVRKYLKSDSGIREELFKKIAAYNNFSASAELFRLLEEDICLVTSRFEAESLKRNASDFSESLKDISSSLNRTLLSAVLSVSQLTFPSIKLSEEVATYFRASGREIAKEADHDEMDDLKAIFEMTQHKNTLNLVANNNQLKEIKMDLVNFNEVNQIKLSLNGPVITGNDNRVLLKVLGQVSNISGIEIYGTPEGISHRTLVQVLPVIFQNAKELLSLKIDLTKCQIKDDSGIFIMQNILPLLTKLKTLNLNLQSTSIGNESINAFILSNPSIFNQLETFELNLQQTSISDSISKIALPMPNLKRFNLGLMQTLVGDQSIEKLASQSLLTMQNLESCTILLAVTHLTNKSLLPLFSSFGNLKELCLGLGKIKITSETLEVLGNVIMNMKVLENLELRLSYSPEVNDENMEFIWEAIENLSLRRLALSLFETEVTDIGIVELSEAISPSIDRLEIFEIWLSNPEITDKGIRSLFQSLPDLKELTLRFWNLRITDKVGEELFTEMLPRMKNLKKLEAYMINTTLSKKIQANIIEEKKKLAERGVDVK